MPVTYLTPLRVRTAWRSTSARTRASTSAGLASTSIGLPLPARLIQLPGKVPQLPVQPREPRARSRVTSSAAGKLIKCSQRALTALSCPAISDRRRSSSARSFMVAARTSANVSVRTPASSGGPMVRSAQSYAWRHHGCCGTAIISRTGADAEPACRAAAPDWSCTVASVRPGNASRHPQARLSLRSRSPYVFPSVTSRGAQLPERGRAWRMPSGGWRSHAGCRRRRWSGLIPRPAAGRDGIWPWGWPGRGAAGGSPGPGQRHADG